MGYFGVRELSYEDLQLYTNNFSEENFIGKVQFARVYRGKIPESLHGVESKEVTVKIWEDPKIYRCDHPEDNQARLFDEVMLLQHKSMVSHPNLTRLIGYCEEGDNVGIVYDFKALDSVFNLLLKEGFTWLQRINVALQFSRLLEFLHTPSMACLPYLVRNIDARHLLLDKDYNMKFIDFGMLSGGILPDRRKEGTLYGCYGYIDPCSCGRGAWSEECDVFAFGVVLLGLISKRSFDVEKERHKDNPNYLEDWAENEYKKHKSRLGHWWLKFSLVNQSLEADSDFYSSDGPKITKLAMNCLERWPEDRPTMKQVAQRLLNLRIVRDNAVVLEVEQILLDYPHKSSLAQLSSVLCFRKMGEVDTC